MSTRRVGILNPKAARLLKALAYLNLIAIKEEKDDEFLKVIKKIRNKAKDSTLTLDDITKEVETVRAQRYANKV